MNQQRNETHITPSRFGTRAVLLVALLLAALILLNLLISLLPRSAPLLDTTANELYTLSDVSVNYLSAIDEDVTIYYVCQSGTEAVTMKLFLDRFIGHSPHLTLKTLDPTADAALIAAYSSETLSNNSVIVASGKRARAFDYISLYYVNLSGYLEEQAFSQNFSFSEYQSMLSNPLYSQALASLSATLFFTGDASLTGAIEYVLADDIPTAYILSGHGETALTETFLGGLSTYGLEYKNLDLTGDDAAIPADASALVINAPTTDLSAAESAKIAAFLASGGDLFLTTRYANLNLPNLLGLLAAYGVSPTAGLVFEGDSTYHIANAPYNLFAKTVSTTHAATATVASSGYQMLLPLAHGISMTNSPRDGLRITPLFQTGETAYLSGENETKTDEGVHTLGVAVSDTLADGEETRIVWLGSPNALTDTTLSYTSNGNLFYFAFAMSWCSRAFVSELPAIDAANMNAEPFAPTPIASGALVLFMLVLLPVALLGGGFVVWLRRRRK